MTPFCLSIGGYKTVKLILALLLGFCFTTFAAERELGYSDELLDYHIKFDDVRTAKFDMQAAAWLSPFNTEDPKIPFYYSSSENATGVDKQFGVPSLESWAWSLPGVAHWSSPHSKPDFLTNAAEVVKYGQNELTRLHDLKLPEVLEPVREYLADNLRFSLSLATARLAYVRTGDTKPLVELLCKYCSCQSDPRTHLMSELEHVADQNRRISLTYATWPNEVLKCHSATKPPFPIAAWRRFLQQFGVQEIAKRKNVD